MSDNVKLQLPRRRDLQELVDLELVDPKEIPIELGRFFLNKPITEASQADILNKMQGHVRYPKRGDGFDFPKLRATWDFNLGSGKADISNLKVLPYSLMRILDFRCNFTQSEESKRTVGELNGGFYNTHILFKDVFSLRFEGFKDIGIKKDLSPQKQIEHFKEWVLKRYKVDLSPITYIMPDEMGATWLVQKPSLSETDMLIRCSCPFYRFYLSYANVVTGKIDLSGRYKSYTRKPRSRHPRRNPKNIIGECKHIYFLVSSLSDDKVVVDSYKGIKIDGKSLYSWFGEYEKEVEYLNRAPGEVDVVRGVEPHEDDVKVVSAEPDEQEVLVVKAEPEKEPVSVSKEKPKKSKVSVQKLGKADEKPEISIEKTDEPITDETDVLVKDIEGEQEVSPVSVFTDDEMPEAPDLSDLYKDAEEEKPKKKKKTKKEPEEKTEKPKVTVTKLPKAQKKEPKKAQEPEQDTVQDVEQDVEQDPVVYDKPVTDINPNAYYKDVEEEPIVLTPPVELPSSITKTNSTVGGVPIKLPNKALINSDAVRQEDSDYYLSLWNSMKDALYLKSKPTGYPTELLNSLAEFGQILKSKPEYSMWGYPNVVDLLMIVALNLNKEAIETLKRNVYDDVDLIADDFGSLRKFMKQPVINRPQ